MLTDQIAGLWQWLVDLPPDFAFLLCLPFLVALAAFLAELRRRPRSRHTAHSD